MEGEREYHNVMSLLSRLSYEPDLNCHWTVTGPPDKIIKMRFTSFNLERRQNDTHHSCWDYVEVRNGDGPYSPQVGVFCGATAPPDLRSSRDHLWVKFFTDSDISAPGFSAVFTAEDPVCGSLVPINATNITQVKVSWNRLKQILNLSFADTDQPRSRVWSLPCGCLL